MKIISQSVTGFEIPHYSSNSSQTYSERQFLDNAKKLAYEITNRLEGGKVNSIQTTDSGIISYGKHQATLKSGTLYKVIDYFTDISDTKTSKDLNSYLIDVKNKDAELKNNRHFLSLLEQASFEPQMNLAQDKVFSEDYWIPAVNKAKELGLKSQISYAILYDTKIQGGLNTVLDKTFKSLKQNEVNEKQFLDEFLVQRKDYLLTIAKSKRAKGDTSSAKLLENSAKNRIAYLEFRLANDYF